MIEVEVVNRQDYHDVDSGQLVEASRYVFQTHSVTSGRVNIAVLDNKTIQELNREFLDHDYPTDVLSFMLEREQERLEGEIAVSAEMAVQQAVHFDWPAAHELVLYVIHGALHLVGLDDKRPESLEQMRSAEQQVCQHLGIGDPPQDHPLQNPTEGDGSTR